MCSGSVRWLFSSYSVTVNTLMLMWSVGLWGSGFGQLYGSTFCLFDLNVHLPVIFFFFFFFFLRFFPFFL